MSKQIAVRLPDDVVASVDLLVAEGAAPSRAAVVTRALRRELRRAAAERDADLLEQHGEDEDLAAMVAWASNRPLDLD